MSNAMSDIMIMTKDPVDDGEAETISRAIYGGASSAIISFNSKSRRIFWSGLTQV